MKTHPDLLRYLSHLVSAPVIAAPIFVSLARLENARIFYTIVSVLSASVVPIVGILYFARLEGVDYDIPERGARARPFVFAIASYLAGFLLLVSSGAPLLMSGLMLAYSINTSVMFLVTLFWKISVHAAGVTGPLTFLVFRLGFLWGLLYLLVLPVGLLRLRLGQHTVLQLFAGAILSAALTWTEIIFLVPLIP
jgi:membrane-associated phospholipid phosphatase